MSGPAGQSLVAQQRQGIPPQQAPITDPTGHITGPWFRYFVSLAQGQKYSVSPAVAAAGSRQGNATQLASDFNIVTQGGGGVSIVPQVPQSLVFVWNRTSTALNVYPATGVQIDELGANQPYVLAPGAAQIFAMVSSIQSFSLITASSGGGGGSIEPLGSLFNVLDYGAVADGVTDNHAAIQAACTAAFHAGGGTVYFPPSPVGKEYMVAVTSAILVGPNTTVLGIRGQSIIKAIQSTISGVVGIRGIFECAQTTDGSPSPAVFGRGAGGSGAQFNTFWTDNGNGTFSYSSSTLAAAGSGYRPPNTFGAGSGDIITVNGPNPGEFLTFQVATTGSWRGPIATYTFVSGSPWTTNPATVSQSYSIGEYDSDWIYTPPTALGDNYVFKDLVIDGNDYNSTTSTAPVVQGLSNYLFGISGKGIKDVTVTGCEIRYCPGSGLQFYRHRRATITDNYIHHCGWGVAAGGDRNAVSCFGFFLTNQPSANELNSRGLLIENNHFHDCKDVNISYSTHRGVVIANNNLRGAFAIEGQATSFQVQDTLATDGGIEVPNDQVIIGNYMDGIRADAFSTTPNGTGVAPQAGNEGRCLIANNIIRNFPSYGIECTNLNNYRVSLVGNILENVCISGANQQGIFVDAADVEVIANSLKTQASGNAGLLVSSRCRSAMIASNVFDGISLSSAISIIISDTTPGDTQFIKVVNNVFSEVQKNGVLLEASSSASPVTVDVLEISNNLFRNCDKGGGGGNQEIAIQCVNSARMTIDTILLHNNHVWQVAPLRGTSSPFVINNTLISGTSCSLLSIKDNIFCRGFTYPAQMPGYNPLILNLDGNSYDGNRVTDLPSSGSLPITGHFTQGDRLRTRAPTASGADQRVCTQSGSLFTNGGWVANTSYPLTTNGAPTTLVGGGMVQEVTVAGTSGASAPTWNTTIGGTTTDGTVTWTCIDTQAIFKALLLSA